MRSALRAVAACAVLMFASGCMVRSSMPLVPQSDDPVPAVTGNYRPYVGVEPAKTRGLPAAVRADCFSPGYRVEVRNRQGKPTGRRVRLTYCSWDEDKKAAMPLLSVLRKGSSFAVSGPEGEAEVRFARQGEGLYLVQLDSTAQGKPAFDYLLYRPKAPDLELFPLFCGEDGFPAAAADGMGVECRIDSLATIAPALDAFAAKVRAGGQAPLVILKRVN